jgi:hypothetical protein
MKAILFSIFLFLPILIFGQSNYYKGYIVKNTGDTIKGYINYLDWSYSPKIIDFKKNVDDKEIVKYSPKEIKSFQINEYEDYISYTGKISSAKNVFPNYPTSLDTSRNLETVFLEKLASGKNITLYFNGQPDKTHYFVAEGAGEPIELKYYPYYLDESTNIKNDNLYIGQLMLLYNKYVLNKENFLNNFGKILYERNYLVKVILEINNNGSSNSAKTFKTINLKKAKVRFFSGTGLITSRTKYELTLPNYYYGEPYYFSHITNSTYPKIDIGLDFILRPTIQTIIIRAEFSTYYLNVNYSENLLGVNFNQVVGSFTPQIIYNFYNVPNLKIYIDGGFRLNFSSLRNLSYTHSNTGIKIVDPEELAGYNNSDFTNYNWLNFPIQTGLVIKNKYEFFFSYASYSKINNSFSTQIFNLGFKILLQKSIK